MDEHPVWYVYDELRTARLNTLYYQARLASARKANGYQELAMAASASTGVGGLWIFATGYGGILWKLLTTVAALLAVYRTVFKPSERVRKLEAHVVAWAHLEVALTRLRRRIHEDQSYNPQHSQELDGITEQKKSLLANLIEVEPSAVLLDACFEQVNRELPAEAFYVPGRVKA